MATPRVTAPILSRQQWHLAFISEFNVQMLYLPRLKNVVADVIAAATTTPNDFTVMAAEENRCLEMQRARRYIPHNCCLPSRH
jgi:hypothetical protein